MRYPSYGEYVRARVSRFNRIEEQLAEQRAYVDRMKSYVPSYKPSRPMGTWRRMLTRQADGTFRKFFPSPVPQFAPMAANNPFRKRVRSVPTFKPMAANNPFRKRVRSVPTFKPMAPDNPFRVRTGVRPGTQPFKF